jgi:hypothetical protein
MESQDEADFQVCETATKPIQTFLSLDLEGKKGPIGQACLGVIFHAVVHHSDGKIDKKHAPEDHLSRRAKDAWNDLLEQHTDLCTIMSECIMAQPPSFSRIRSLS